MNRHSPPVRTTFSASCEIEAPVDRLSLYAALSENGARADTMLFEAAEGASFLLDRAAARIMCRGQKVAVEALSPNGERLIATIAARLEPHVAEAANDKVRLRFERSEAHDCDERLKAPSPFDVLRAVTTGLADFGGDPHGLACLGLIAFDHVDLFEDLPANAEDRLGFPDFLFWVAESLIVFESGSARAICTSFAGPAESASALSEDASERLERLIERCGIASGAGPFVPVSKATAQPKGAIGVDMDDAAFAALVVGLKAHIASGDVYQIVASRTFSTPCLDPFAAFARLRSLDPSPYSFFVSAGDFQLFGASPETSVRIYDDEGPCVELKPIAGTRPRVSNGDEDDRLEAELRLDPKEQAEHMMLVDLARNDVARVSKPGTRRVSQLMGIERYARVMHLVSKVTGRLKDGFDAIDALKACLNMGTLTGAPKIRATELLREAERTKRGPYGGAIGWLDGAGAMDSAILIRSAIVKGGTAYVRAGAGIVFDSDPEAEADETRRKASAVLSALGGTP